LQKTKTKKIPYQMPRDVACLATAKAKHACRKFINIV
jgi:hypothetical protein